MATLAETFDSLLGENDLTTISVQLMRFQSGGVEHRSWSANAHWLDSGGRCSSAHGDSPEEAVAKAVAEANALRGRGVIVPDEMEMGEAA